MSQEEKSVIDEWEQMCGGSWEDQYGTILNPSAVGNPDETPVVQLSPRVARLFNRCTAASASTRHDDGKCGGVNGWHADDCERPR